MEIADDVGLPNCRVCCSPPLEADFGAVAEFYGHSWQDGDISCSSTGSVKGCSMSVSMSFEADQITGATAKLESMWRILNS